MEWISRDCVMCGVGNNSQNDGVGDINNNGGVGNNTNNDGVGKNINNGGVGNNGLDYPHCILRPQKWGFSNINKVCHVGTLNLCQKFSSKMQSLVLEKTSQRW